MTDIEAARELEALKITATPILARALGLGALALRNQEARQADTQELLELLGAVTVKHAIILQKNGKEKTDEPEDVPRLRP